MLVSIVPKFLSDNTLSLYIVVNDYGLQTVQEYMYHIRNNAETSVRKFLKDVVERAGTNVLEAIDYLDDGSPVSRLSLHNFFTT